jgi:hypothetical protein
LPGAPAQVFEPGPYERDRATRIAEVLSSLPRGHVVYWNDPGEGGRFRGHADIWAPVVCVPLKIGWAWTSEDNDGRSQPLNLVPPLLRSLIAIDDREEDRT